MKTKIQKCLIVAIILGTSSLIADAADWTNWNNRQSIGSFYAVAGTAKETVAVGIDGRIATRNNTTGIWTTQTFTNAPDFQAMVHAIRHAKNPFAGDPDPDFRAIVYAKNQYVVVRETGCIMTSPDGLKWTRRASVTNDCAHVGSIHSLHLDRHRVSSLRTWIGQKSHHLHQPGRRYLDAP